MTQWAVLYILNIENNKRGKNMTNIEFRKWFSENLVSGEKDPVKGIYNYTIAGYSFTTKPTNLKNWLRYGHLSLYDVTNGKVCIATRIYDDYGAIEDSIYRYLYKKIGITNG